MIPLNFEESLYYELQTITDLNNKVYPLNAPEDSNAPFAVYLSEEGKRDETLDGYLNSMEIRCDINILHNTYGELKNVTGQVINKCISFIGRKIGVNGPLVQNVTYDKSIEVYEADLLLYRALITISVRI